jgi:hypothetical protein
VRFRRRSSSDPDATGAEGTSEVTADAAEPGGSGPHDASELDTDELDCIDLGSLLVTPVGEVEMRLTLDEQSGEVTAAVLLNDEGALELRAFAASRGGGSWDELRPRIAAETARMGGTATEQQGTFGSELICLVPLEAPAGEQAVQASRVTGHEGPAWLLRATLMGQPAVDPEVAAPWDETIRRVVVRRGREARPPGSPLPLTLPPQARQVE